MSAHLVIGYGNLDRGDDGVAYHVINALRGRLRRRPLAPLETGLEDLNGEQDSIFLPQLLPEVMETAAAYDRVVFVDAHILQNGPGVSLTPVTADFVPSAFTHHMSPSMFLGMLRILYGRDPCGDLLSIRGEAFDLFQDLSAGTRGWIEPAVRLILETFRPGRKRLFSRIWRKDSDEAA